MLNSFFRLNHVYIYIYYIYTYIYTHIHIHAHRYIHIHIFIYIPHTYTHHITHGTHLYIYIKNNLKDSRTGHNLMTSVTLT